MVAAKAPAPWSSRSSRATAVTTAYDRPISATASATRSGSPGSSGPGRRVSTRQKPHARVHRSPLIMKVAVPSFQHSKTFGQPASSHTVTRSLLRINAFKRRYSGPVSRGTRIHAGLRPTGGTSPGPAPRLNGARSLLGPPSGSPSLPPDRATSARSTGPAAHRSDARATTRSTTSSIGTSIPSAASDVTPYSLIPQGTIRAKWSRSGATLRAKPCMVRLRVSFTPMAATFRGRGPSGSTQTPGYRPRRPTSSRPRSRQVAMTTSSTDRT